MDQKTKETIMSMIGTKRVKEISQETGASVGAIRMMAQRAAISTAMTGSDHHKWTNREIETLRSLAGKMPQRAIAKEMGLRSKQIQTAARRYKIDIKFYGYWSVKYPNEDVILWGELRKSGLSVGEISRKFEVPEPTVFAALQKRGIEKNGN